MISARYVEALTHIRTFSVEHLGKQLLELSEHVQGTQHVVAVGNSAGSAGLHRAALRQGRTSVGARCRQQILTRRKAAHA